ncbi:YceI family protein [Oceanomicrobium pacificus]|uniref:Lipid/polyisoprenoid-binding YceI-like domain-containing protein n=1 Tax=Oceanomicrobium pacificus TaxID=2692916 RepID=A0A6B0TYF6_9RHOB|nr:YceI family protein [Oceanomicrobium pacificus]MXU63941.1 hypothetical protein [Oceanomicrobium pacificus]
MRTMLKLLCLVLLLPVAAAAETWRIDPSRTAISVTVSYIGEGRIAVRFPSYEAALRFDPDRLDATQARITLDASRAETGLSPVDLIVRGQDYLHAARFPGIRFEMDRLTQTGPSDAVIDGQVTIRGVTQPLRLDAKVVRYRPDAARATDREIAFRLTGQVDRNDFGMVAARDTIAPGLPVLIDLVLVPK